MMPKRSHMEHSRGGRYQVVQKFKDGVCSSKAKFAELHAIPARTFPDWVTDYDKGKLQECDRH